MLKLFYLEIFLKIDYRGKGHICLEFAKGFGEGAKNSK
jgi:hypothetical protein